jgi:K+-sensing histidine kinase KdpD
VTTDAIARLPDPTAPLSARRYDPGELLVSLDDFGPEDRRRIRRLYAFAQGIYLDWLAHDARSPEAALERLRGEDLQGLREDVADLGDDTPRDPRISSITHDLRGGTVAAFMSLAELVVDQEAPTAREVEYLQQLIWLVRDEAKVMRGLIVDLDPDLREPDLEHEPHSVTDLVRKWQGMRYDVGTAPVTLRVSNHLGDGALANRCLEAGAIDRVSYNFLNNAARFSASREVEIDLRPLPGTGMGRVTVVNELGAGEMAWLEDRLKTDPAILFRRDVTHGGSGIGLAACAEVVGAAFELTPDQAIRERVIGYRVDEGRFYAWFCWPTSD